MNKSIDFIDAILNKITMYRLVFYELTFLLLAAGTLGYLGFIPVYPVNLAYSVALIFYACWIANRVFAALFEAPYNPESTWITALILALIISPPAVWLDAQYLSLALWASAWAVASKYIFAIWRKHLFNPAALGVAMTAIFLGLSASWWVGTLPMAPFVLIGGLLIVRKIHRFDLWWAFSGAFFTGTIVFSLMNGGNIANVLYQSFISAPIFFFGMVMLTEPATTPPTRFLRVLYGVLVGFLFLPNVHFGSVYLTPELALLIGNVFSYLVSSKAKLSLTLLEKIRLSNDVYEFVFASERPFSFRAGQYLEWTLPHKRRDSRSVRRYFTIASSPTEKHLRLGVKFYNPASTFKKTLANMTPGGIIVAAQLAGDFTLPKDGKRKLVFIAGGIGITPFRSQLQYLLDKKETRPITLLYANKTPQDVVYREVLVRAERELGIRIIHSFSDLASLPPGSVGKITPEVIVKAVLDYRECTFYVSGPQGMVEGLTEMLLALGIHRAHIRTDYFPGFA